MVAPLIQRRPAELSCPCTVCTAEYVFAVRGGRWLSVALIARVVARKCARSEVRRSSSLMRAARSPARGGGWGPVDAVETTIKDAQLHLEQSFRVAFDKELRQREKRNA